jgi:hypothetical protein
VRKASFLHKIAEQARFLCAEAGELDEVFAEGQPLFFLHAFKNKSTRGPMFYKVERTFQ